MIRVNVRLILAVPVFLLAALVGLVGMLTELGVLYGLVTLDLGVTIGCLIGGAVIAIVSAILFGIGGLIMGDTDEAAA